MSTHTALLIRENKKRHIGSYGFNRSITPFPEQVNEKSSPPLRANGGDNTHQIKVAKELTLEEKAQEYMDQYRKAERMIVINFYTGGGAYKRGILDAIYRGFNPMNP